jgi:hypothetical protein
MLVRAERSFIATRYGEVEKGHEFDCEPHLAMQWEAAGMIKVLEQTYDTKVIKETAATKNIPLESGAESASGSSQAAPASRKKTRRKSETSESSS